MITPAAGPERLSSTYDLPGNIAPPESLFPELEAALSLLDNLTEEGCDAHETLAAVLSEPIPSIDRDRFGAFFSDQPIWTRQDPRENTDDPIVYSIIAYRDTGNGVTPCGMRYGFDQHNGRLRSREIVEFSSDFSKSTSETQESFVYEGGYLITHTIWSSSKPDRHITDIFRYVGGKNGAVIFDSIVRNVYDVRFDDKKIAATSDVLVSRE